MFSRVSMITQGGVCNASTIQTFCRTRDGWSNCFYNVINAVFNCFSYNGLCPFWLGLIHSLFLVNAWLLEKGRFSSIDLCFTGKSDGFSLLPFLKKCL